MAVHHLDTRPRAAPAVAASPLSPAPARRPRRRPWGPALVALALVAAAGAGAWALLRPIPVTIDRAADGEAVDAVYASGVVEYVRQARVAPVVTAPIRQVLVREGDDVRIGQGLAQLEDGPQLGTTLQLEAQAAQARAVAARAQRLFDVGFGARAANEDAQAQRRASEAAAASARARLRDYRISAPFAGRILRRDAEPGDLASAGQPLFVIADLTSLRITADVDERDVGRLETGMQAAVRADAYPGRTFLGRITEITPQGDATGRVFRVRVAMPSETPLKPGMTVETNLVTARRAHAVLVPSAAMSKGAVWVAKGGRVERRSVRTGAAGADRTEITQGLTAGERVVLNPSDKLRPGSRIAIRQGS